MTKSLPSNLYVGTQSWSCKDWVGVFYPKQTKPADYIAEYAKHYAAVEIDSTFYRIPSKSTVAAWNEKTPENFIFAAKIPQVITHEKFLRDCQDELKAFLNVMDILEDKLGALLFQFRYYRKAEIASGDEFIERLAPFLKKFPTGYRFALEVRNKTWLNEELLDLLRKHKIAFALTDHPWMENVNRLMERLDVVSSDFCYVRWLGDRKKIEEETKRWDSVIIDRRREMTQWIPAIKQLMARDIGAVYAFFNNHYAGYAPGSIDLFKEMWKSHT
jgi:uncharacterized protein YecE (DUF72 family)